VTYKW